MPRVTKNKSDKFEYPVDDNGKTIGKMPKEKKVKLVVSNNHVLPTVTVEDVNKLKALNDLKTFKEMDGVKVTFDGLFIRQNNFGKFEFSIPDSEYETLSDEIASNFEDMDGGPVAMNDYSKRYQINGKLSEKYKGNNKNVPIPKENSIVRVDGVLREVAMKGKNYVYLTIENMESIVDA